VEACACDHTPHMTKLELRVLAPTLPLPYLGKNYFIANENRDFFLEAKLN